MKKNNISFKGLNNISREPIRGDIFYANLDEMENNIGCEQKGTRPILIIQNDKGNKHSSTIIVAVLTTNLKRTNLPTHVIIPPCGELNKVSAVCLEQIKILDKLRIGSFVGHIDKRTMKRIDEGIRTSLGLKTQEMELNDEKVETENSIITKEEKINIDKTIFDSLENNWMDMLENQYKFFDQIGQYSKNLGQMLSNTEDEIEDILNYVEELDLNVEKGYRIYTVLQECRRRKKSILDEIYKTNIILQNLDCVGMATSLKITIDNLVQIKEDKWEAKVLKDINKILE